MDLSKNIREIRESLKIKQLEIAERLGIDPANYSRIEKKGNNINFELLQQIADVFQMSVVDIINYPNVVVSGADSEIVKELEKENEIWRNRVEELEEFLNGYREIRKEVQEMKLKLENEYEEKSEVSLEIYVDLLLCAFVAYELKRGSDIDKAYKFGLGAYCEILADREKPQTPQEKEDLVKKIKIQYSWAYQLDFEGYLAAKIRIKYNDYFKTNE